MKYRNSAAQESHFTCYTPSKAVVRAYGRNLKGNAPGLIGKLKGKTVVDLGCGFGSTYIHAIKNQVDDSTRFIHIDQDPRVFDEEERRSRFGVKYDQAYDRRNELQLVGDVLSLPLPDNSVDMVHYDYMFADNPALQDQKEQAFKEIDRIVAPGGFIIELGTGPLEDYRYSVEIGRHDSSLTEKIDSNYTLLTPPDATELIIIEKKSISS